VKKAGYFKPNTMKKTIEEVAEKANGYGYYCKGSEKYNAFNEGFISGAKYQSGQMYSEEEVIKLLDAYRMQLAYGERVFKRVNEWFNLNKKK